MSANYSFLADYAKSSRSKCKYCKISISKGDLRLGTLAQAPFSGYKIKTWYHVDCLFTDNYVGYIDGIELLRWDDQMRIKNKQQELITLDSLPNQDLDMVKFEVNPKIVYCNACVGEDLLKLSSKDSKTPPQFYHVDCLLTKKGSTLNVPRFDSLNDVDRETVINNFKNWRYDKGECADGVASKCLIKDATSDEDLKNQTNGLWQIRNHLEKEIPEIREMTELLKHNNQYVPRGPDNVLNSLTDCMAFGSIPPCPECGGVVSYCSYKYKCNSNVNGGIKCPYTTDTVDRYLFVIPQTYNEKVPKIDNICEPRLRVLSKILNFMDQVFMEEGLCNLKRLMVDLKYQSDDDDENTAKLSITDGMVHDQYLLLETTSVICIDERLKEPFLAILRKVELQNNVDVFYKLELRKSDSENKWWVVRTWGEINSKYGDHKITPFDNFDTALKSFTDQYFEKTSNLWSNRPSFAYHSNKYDHVDVDYHIISSIDQMSSSLPMPIQRLIQFIFKFKNIKKELVQFDIKLHRNPLGTLSDKKLEELKDILEKLTELVHLNPIPPVKILEYSTKFYTLMPNERGSPNVPLDGMEILQSKREILQKWRNILSAYRLSLEDRPLGIDECYEQLDNDIGVVDEEGETYKRIATYFNNSSVNKANNKTMSIVAIFSLDCHREHEDQAIFNEVENHRMLWHGSALVNWSDILTEGLLIAPTNALRVGDEFGPGIYFSDRAYKSGNYCFTEGSAVEGLMLLCEVALGNIVEQFSKNPNFKRKKGENSCKGVGKCIPDPIGDTPVQVRLGEKEVIYPMGPPIINDNDNVTLAYNEYVVYDKGQVRQRFLVRVLFESK